MSIPPEPHQEHPSTYFVQDRTNQEELERLHIQDHMTTAGMGGVLPEQANTTSFQRVLDVGCGTGNWLIELAKTSASASLLIGVDASRTFVAYARAQAEAAQVSDRVEFHVMDALRMLEFPDSFFHLVNQRFGLSWLRTWDWPKLLQEYWRVVRSEGIVRITEGDTVIESSSPALLRLNHLSLQALYQAGHFFTCESDGMTSQLARLLHQHGFLDVQARVHVVVARAGTLQGQRFIEDMKALYRTIVPFLQKWLRIPDDYEDLYRQMLAEMQQPDFCATMRWLTAWGTKV